MRLKRLRELRHRLGLSQEALARRAGITAATVHRIEAAKASPHFGTARLLAQALGVSVAQLEGERNHGKQGTSRHGR